ncbi:MAG: 7-carboxy-7-deazaguanine synthase QueE [Bacteroidales bacterium]|jgi:organic radical activating enzyme|nr:7-carboxy-7-deazaguanine synthase QueE [Bacteroidales bacterium]
MINKNKIPILEEFYSIQGEGANSGKATYFVRLGGCDLACHWCDSKETWNPKNYNYKEIGSIIENAKKTTTDSILITGGEPLAYNFNEFCKQAKSNKFKMLLETSGAFDISGNWDWICMSPKRQKPPKEIFYQIANEMKVIIYEPEDLAWAEECEKKVHNKNMALYLQPEWNKFETTKLLAIDYVKKYPQWKLSIQIHKLLNIP